MKVVKPGRRQNGWAKEFECTGRGNDGGGCGAVLLVEQGDLFHTAKHCYDGSSDYFVTFQCGACGVLTDIPDRDSPTRAQSLPHWTAWQKARKAEAAKEEAGG